MLLKLIFIFALSLAVVDVVAGAYQKTEKNISFSVEKVWQSYRKKDPCKCEAKENKDDTWKVGVQQYYDGCRKASWKFRGIAYKIADVVLKSVKDYLTKLMYFSNTNSTVLTASSTALLWTMSKFSKLGKSALIIMEEFDKVLPDMVKDFNQIVTKLDIIGYQLRCSFNDAVAKLADVISYFMKEFLKNSKIVPAQRKNVNYEPVFKQCQKLMNIVALIAETLLNKCDLASRADHEAVTIFSLIFYFMAIAVQGVNSCAQDFLIVQKCPISQNIKAVSESFEYVLVEVSQAVSAVMFPFTKSITELLTIFVNVVMAFNTAVKDTLGVFEGVSITAEQIKQNLSKGAKASVGGVATKGTTILKGIIPK